MPFTVTPGNTGSGRATMSYVRTPYSEARDIPSVKTPDCADYAWPPKDDLPLSWIDAILTVRYPGGEIRMELPSGFLRHYSFRFRLAIPPDPTTPFDLTPVENKAPGIIITTINWMLFGTFMVYNFHNFQFRAITVSDISHLVEVYILGIEWQMQAVRNATLSMIYALAKQSNNPLIVQARRIYEATDPRSPLRKLLLRILVDECPADIDALGPDVLPYEALRDLASGLVKSRRVGPENVLWFDQWLQDTGNPFMEGNFCARYHFHDPPPLPPPPFAATNPPLPQLPYQ